MGVHLDFATATDRFYEVLFEQIPSIKERFADNTHQREMFLLILQFIDRNHANDEILSDYLQMLGDKHKMKGLNRVHMKMGRVAFEQAIEAGGKNLKSEQKQTYLDALVVLERMMGFEVVSE